MKIIHGMIHLALVTIFSFCGCEYGDIAEIAAKKLAPPLFVAVGDSGTILYSEDGIAWNFADSAGSTDILCDVTSGNGSIVAVGVSGGVLTSVDGKTWKSAFNTGAGMYSVCYGNGRFVFVGEYFAGYTTDLSTWINQSSSVASSALYHIFYGDNRFLAAGMDTALETPDGSTWQVCTPGTGIYQGGIYVNGIFTIVADNYSVRYSTGDLLAWYNSNQGVNTDVPNIMFGIAYGNGIYVIAGGAGQIARSTNGLNWTNITVSSSDLLDITYGNGKFVAVEMNGRIWYSADGITWTQANSPTSYSLNAITYRP